MTRKEDIDTSINIPEEEHREPVKKPKLCPECFSEVQKGMTHQCNKQNAISNLLQLVQTLGSDSAEQLAARILKHKMSEESIPSGSQFKISTGGNPLTGMK